ncbi:hypothetical protein BGZ90_003922 [Linnemannia elongata]|nr:hypothetical protein BGZ90_003922 [Linnemannia elongata]
MPAPMCPPILCMPESDMHLMSLSVLRQHITDVQQGLQHFNQLRPRDRTPAISHQRTRLVAVQALLERIRRHSHDRHRGPPSDTPSRPSPRMPSMRGSSASPTRTPSSVSLSSSSSTTTQQPHHLSSATSTTQQLHHLPPAATITTTQQLHHLPPAFTTTTTTTQQPHHLPPVITTTAQQAEDPNILNMIISISELTTAMQGLTTSIGYQPAPQNQQQGQQQGQQRQQRQQQQQQHQHQQQQRQGRGRGPANPPPPNPPEARTVERDVATLRQEVAELRMQLTLQEQRHEEQHADLISLMQAFRRSLAAGNLPPQPQPRGKRG